MSVALRLVRGDSTDGTLPPIQAYELYLRAGNRSARYIKDTMATLARLEAETGKPIEQTTPVEVTRYLSPAHWGAATRYAYFTHIRGFFAWWTLEGGIDITNRLPRPKLPRREPRPVSKSSLRALLDLPMHHRTRVMILLAALAGLRVSEIAQVRGEDIDLSEKTMRVKGKGGRVDTVPLHPLLMIEARYTMPQRGWWFPANNRRPGSHIHGKSVSDIIGQAMRRADVAGTPHSLRQYFGTALVETGADLRTTQVLMRHSNMQTTSLYVAVADERRAEAVERLNPRSGGDQ